MREHSQRAGLDLGVSRRSASAGPGAAKRRGDEVSDSDREHLHRAEPEPASLSARGDPTADLPSVLGENLKRRRRGVATRSSGLRRCPRAQVTAMIGQIGSDKRLAHHQPPIEARNRARRRARSSAGAAGCARHHAAAPRAVARADAERGEVCLARAVPARARWQRRVLRADDRAPAPRGVQGGASRRARELDRRQRRADGRRRSGASGTNASVPLASSGRETTAGPWAEA